jgi:hypothetical protein
MDEVNYDRDWVAVLVPELTKLEEGSSPLPVPGVENRVELHD